MKKLITILLLSGGAHIALNAQLVLTQAVNEPVIGDLLAPVKCDSVVVIPRNIGLNQSWDFSSMLPKSTVFFSRTYISPSTVASASLFSSATLVAEIGLNQYEFYRSVAGPTAQLELIGNSYPGRTDSLKNPKIEYLWPMALGSSNTDTYSVTLTGPGTAYINGTVTTAAVGTGTLLLPGGYRLYPILQVVSNNYSVVVQSAPTPSSTYNFYVTTYQYYHSISKFPVLTVTTQRSSLAATSPNFTAISYNKPLTLGLPAENQKTAFAIYPNPASGNFNLSIPNLKNEKSILQIFDAAGKLATEQYLGNSLRIEENISIKNLLPGFYLVKIQMGNETLFNKLIVQ